MADTADQSFIAQLIARLRPSPKPSAPVGAQGQHMPEGPQLRKWQLENQERAAQGMPGITYAQWVQGNPTALYGQ